eukprot:CAMPEP_0194026214 /NCGR_PEP_ID=MMETSP0009_2-20130614/528_1 /TAXON_ID=210454 /ORGANISM="Grammatophora oceanica, Strain CCMP 410" /LENGTH=255 /DNA_ID=CAMNT_0038664781 /DNA_START=44 /DNA_END=811 /DNA_ORIENTATION=+
MPPVIREYEDQGPERLVVDHHHHNIEVNLGTVTGHENMKNKVEDVHPSKQTPDTLSLKSEESESDQLLGHVVTYPPTEEMSSGDDSSMTNSSMYTSPDEQSLDGQEEEESVVSTSTEDLLAIAQIRIHQQELTEEIRGLKNILREKDDQVQRLTGQLRRATATKCDLVNAFADLEKQKELALKDGSWDAHKVKQDALTQLESKAEMERQFMNDLAIMFEKIVDMDRQHKNAMIEKDFEIAKLEEKIRRQKMIAHE